VAYHDPFIPALPAMRHHTIRLVSQPLSSEFLRAQDCVVIVTDHDGVDYAAVVENSRLVVDTRNATAGIDCPRCQIVKA
jgi:UDP-N-acetyl-D-glucosamine dehydrogenase